MEIPVSIFKEHLRVMLSAIWWLLAVCSWHLPSHAYRSRRATPATYSHVNFAVNNEGNRRIIRPDDINRLFEVNTDEVQEERDEPAANQQDDSSNVLQELNALNDMIESSSNAYDETDNEVANKNNDYTDLRTNVVDIKIIKTIINDVSLRSSASTSKKTFPTQSNINTDGELLVQSSPRITKYVPAPSVRGDPMQYGAYRRTQIVVDDKKNSKNKNKRGKNTIQKGKTTGDRDSFYDALKKLGSGPKDSGSSTTTGVAEPPSNMKPVVPNKPIPKKNKKRIITPDDINNLFKNDKKLENVSEKDDVGKEDEEAEDGEEDVISDAMASSMGLSGPDKNYYKSMLTSNEEIPKWIVDAEKESKAELAKKLKKKKKITDDWRFWLSIIAGVGFITAFYSVFQQTGGGASFPTDGSGFSMPSFNAGPSNDELII